MKRGENSYYFPKYLLSTYYVPAAMQDTNNTIVKQRNSLCP